MENVFEKFYFNEKITSDIKRAFTSNIFKVRKVGIDLGRGKYKYIAEIDYDTFSKFRDQLKNETVKSNIAQNEFQKDDKVIARKKKHLTYNLGKIYVKNVYEGEIDSGEQKLQGIPKYSLVYDINNNSRIAFITTEDAEGFIRQYIATNDKGNDFFRYKFGTTLQQLEVDSKIRVAKLSKNRSAITSTSSVIGSIQDDLEDFFSFDDDTTDDDYEDLETTKKSKKERTSSPDLKKIGIYKLSKFYAENLVDSLGNGYKAFGSHSTLEYKFKGVFKRDVFINNIGEGYKYKMKEGGSFYVIHKNNSEDSYLIFDSEKTYRLASLKKVTEFWHERKPMNFDERRIRWVNDDINNMTTI